MYCFEGLYRIVDVFQVFNIKIIFSECIYGNHIRMFEKQLKDLFRNCHELQLTYLMTLEKHFIFDMTEKDEHDIFIESRFYILHIL